MKVPLMQHDRLISRRTFVRMSAAAIGTLFLPIPEIARAQASQRLVDPYTGTIPLVFPLVSGTYRTPVADNWHVAREGQIYAWNHQNGSTQRAHDGVDVYPSKLRNLSRVYAPLTCTVAAVCVRSSNKLNATVTYRASSTTPPPWDYSRAVDNVARLPLYGNFVWLYCSDINNPGYGYFVFFCHLQKETTIQSLKLDQPLAVNTPVGVMGDTGNAQGTPQLHTEIHYPKGQSFTCAHCTPNKLVTSIDAEASLTQAKLRA
jgi:hypothetical protein